LKVTIAKNAGFCFGVKRAYELACVNSKDCDNVFIFGKLVHNDDVCQDLRRRGIKEIKSLQNAKEGTVIFTAHGIGPKMYANAQKQGFKVIDTTCPKVMKAQRLAKNCAEKGCRVLIFGDKKHKEVKSILEWSGNKAKIIGSLNETKKLKLSRSKKYCLISQTTQNVEEFKKLNNYLRNKLSHFVCFNTICDSTDSRQKEIRKLAKDHDAVVVIGGQDSANSKRLYEIACEINPRTIFVQNMGGLKKPMLAGCQKIAVSAGASTPTWIIQSVVDKIRNFS